MADFEPDDFHDPNKSNETNYDDDELQSRINRIRENSDNTTQINTDINETSFDENRSSIQTKG